MVAIELEDMVVVIDFELSSLELYKERWLLCDNFELNEWFSDGESPVN